MAANEYRHFLILLVMAGALTSCSILEDEKTAPPPKPEKWKAAFDEGYKARRKKDWPVAQEKYTKALKLAKDKDTDPKNIAEILTELGGVYAKQKRLFSRLKGYMKSSGILSAAASTIVIMQSTWQEYSLLGLPSF
jgi:hypothetical protein